MPKFLAYFEAVLAGGPWLTGERWCCADLSLFQLVGGLHYAFPRRMGALRDRFPLVQGLHEKVAALPKLAAYLASERRTKFNQDGIFRHYPELDDE
jgi:glutathione S-transferase